MTRTKPNTVGTFEAKASITDKSVNYTMTGEQALKLAKALIDASLSTVDDVVYLCHGREKRKDGSNRINIGRHIFKKEIKEEHVGG